MVQPSTETIALASELVETLVGSGLPPALAKLYSHHTRLRENRPGLMSWSQSEANERLDDMVRLLEASSIQKQINADQWQQTVRRVGEILEWLPVTDVQGDGISTRLLAAACYQLAGYPARALGLLRENNDQYLESRILTALLKADFVELLHQICEYWSYTLSSFPDEQPSASTENGFPVEMIVVNETVSALGLLCAVMRWGHEPRIQKALDKLTAVDKVMLHSHDRYGWILARLCSEVAETYVQGSMRQHIDVMLQGVSQAGRAAFERYLRQSFQSNRLMAWPSQILGIQELAQRRSFALCTPTGSGKTTVAELAILQSLFLTDEGSEQTSSLAPLVIYLVPSRALATEVEAKLARVLRQAAIGNHQVTVTGLYGGTDWGPTDAWLTSEEKTVLICTYEKAEALMKFLGSFFLPRTTLIVIDEAHTVQFKGTQESLQKSESRSLRLEALGARLFSHLQRNRCRVVALSAVAAEAEGALARWVSQRSDATPVKTFYKSTRQLIGRLECLPGRGFEIRYDLLDGNQLAFSGADSADRPYVPSPFPSHPSVPARFGRGGFTTWVRPYLFWAAMHLAAPDDRGRQRAVLISISQGIGGYAKDFLELLNRRWNEIPNLPVFFQEPTDSEKQATWQKCLRSCEDYYTTNSREYRLLTKGIAVHHGRMPGLLARLMVEVIEQKIVHLVMATSTLSEGVNLPFETVLIPSLQRWNPSRREQTDMNPSEFNNLVGRAGRPGFGTEGRSLVLLSEQPRNRSESMLRNLYLSLIDRLSSQQTDTSDTAVSPLGTLITHLRSQWNRLVGTGDDADFLRWLEQTAPISEQIDSQFDEDAIESLDALDNILLAAIVEVEQLSRNEIDPTDLENELRRIWQQSYAYYASVDQAQLQEIFVHRGRALKVSIYPNRTRRRQLYKTSLPPRSGSQLLIHYQNIRNHLETGINYLSRTEANQFNYIRDTASYLAAVPSFSLRDLTGRGRAASTSWEIILQWWLRHQNSPSQPRDTQVSDWHKFINDNFYYRFNWGLGSVLAIAMEEVFGEGVFEPSSLENWPQLGLPWIVFWMKELIVWGTLDPVSAYLLARVDDVITRTQAEDLSQTYYRTVSDADSNEQLNPILIRNWSQQAFASPEPPEPQHRLARQISVNLLRDFSRASKNKWRVLPVYLGQQIYWLDPAGFPLAICSTPTNWQSDYMKRYDFELNSDEQHVTSELYL